MQQSTCRANGKRRRVARRCLNALGGLSGYAHFLNDPAKIEEYKRNMKFADSVEAIKHAERAFKDRKAKKKRDAHYAKAFTKMGLASDSRVYKKHVQRTKLTIAEMKALAFVECGENLSGKQAVVRQDLINLLPSCAGPDTDDDDDFKDLPELVEEESAAQDSFANISIDVSLQDMRVDECVEVYWKGDRKWYEGRITMVDLDEKQFEVEYFLDNKTLLHNESDYKVRMAC